MLTYTPTPIHQGTSYAGYDSILPMMHEKHAGAGISIRVTATLLPDGVALRADVKSPHGEISRTFCLNGDMSFRWEPVAGFHFIFIITGFRKMKNRFKFRTWLQARTDAPGWGQSWASYNYTLSSASPAFCSEAGAFKTCLPCLPATGVGPEFAQPAARQAVTHSRKRSFERVPAH